MSSSSPVKTKLVLFLSIVCFFCFNVALSQVNETGDAADATPPAPPMVDFDKITTRVYTHGWMMAIAWSVFVPVAIGSSLLRDVIGAKYWFTIHQFSNMLAFAFTTSAFGIEFKNIQELRDAFGDSYQHFSPKDTPHRVVGLVVYILMILQVVSGILRPHLPKAQKTTTNDNNDVEQQGATTTTTTAEVIKKSIARRIFEFEHRFLGFATLALAWYNCHSGIRRLETLTMTDYSRLIKSLWSTIGIISGIIVITWLYNAKTKMTSNSTTTTSTTTKKKRHSENHHDETERVGETSEFN